MKTTLIVLVTLCALGVFADEQKKSEAKKADKAVKTEKQKVDSKSSKEAITGSYIPRNYRKSGTITDGQDPVVVLDRKYIEQSGASDLRELLRKSPAR